MPDNCVAPDASKSTSSPLSAITTSLAGVIRMIDFGSFSPDADNVCLQYKKLIVRYKMNYNNTIFIIENYYVNK